MDIVLMILYLHTHFKNFKLFHNFIRKFYLLILIPLVVFYLKSKFKNIIQIYPRHSILDANYFDAFFSDIDLTIVINDNSDYLQILKMSLTIKKFLKVFDHSEIYFASEFEQLHKLKQSPHWDVVFTLWSIRKINWNYKSILKNPSAINIYKKQRSIQISFSKILSKEISINNEYFLSDFRYLKEFVILGSPCCNFSSPFLETDEPRGIRLMLNEYELKKFKALMPGEEHFEEKKELKNCITNFEILITKASIRTDEALSILRPAKREWLAKLEKQI
jgi:hypothetical protein